MEKSYSFHSVIALANHIVTIECFINGGCTTRKPSNQTLSDNRDTKKNGGKTLPHVATYMSNYFSAEGKCEDIDLLWLTTMSIKELKDVGLQISKHLRIFLRNLRQSLKTFGK